MRHVSIQNTLKNHYPYEITKISIISKHLKIWQKSLKKCLHFQCLKYYGQDEIGLDEKTLIYILVNELATLENGIKAL